MKFNCDMCGTEFEAPASRFKNKKNKYCSTACCGISMRGKPNTNCVICNKEIHIKPSRLARYKEGSTCSKECHLILRSRQMSGENNHQFGLVGNQNSSFTASIKLKKNHNRVYYTIWMPEHPNADAHSRVLLHRYIVEQNYAKFNSKYFYKTEFGMVLYRRYDVHHIDENTLNNDISNLMILTRSEHTALHNKIRYKRNVQLENKIGIVKSGELLETPEEDNQQPSVVKDTKVATKVQRLGGEESTNNPPTSARHTLIGKLHLHELPSVFFPDVKTKYDDIVRATDITLQETVEDKDKEPYR